MNMMKSLIALSIAMGCCLANVVAAKDRDFVIEAFSRSSFLPYVYVDAEIVKRYGAGIVIKKEWVVSRVYFSNESNLWVRFDEEDGGSAKYRVIREITITPIPLVKARYKFGGSLLGLRLRGVAIGDTEMKAMNVAKNGYKPVVKKYKLGGTIVDDIFFFPSDRDTNLYYRFLVKNKKVVGLAIGETE